jgi:Na+-translocating ferredoxin:NAD+ oxidoreductase subunit B
MSFLTALLVIGGLTMVLATLLVAADHFLHVEEDPRIDAVEEMLPHTNCGACGFPGCRAFAEALVAGTTLPAKCTVSSPEQHQRVASFLGVDVGVETKRVARLACAGGDHVSRHHAHYVGIPTCAAATLVAGGGKGCFWGCLGMADCARACTFDAIQMDRHRLPVVDEDKCTACGDCVEACPKDLFSLQPIDQRLWVACNSKAAGDEILADCQVACTACGRCAMDSDGAIKMKNNLPVIDASKGPLTATPSLRCPTGAILWLDPKLGPIKGPSAHRIIREQPWQDAPT